MKELDRKSEMVYRWVRAYIEENKFSSNTKIPSETVLTRKLSGQPLPVCRKKGLFTKSREAGPTSIKRRPCLGSWEAAKEGPKSG